MKQFYAQTAPRVKPVVLMFALKDQTAYNSFVITTSIVLRVKFVVDLNVWTDLVPKDALIKTMDSVLRVNIVATLHA